MKEIKKCIFPALNPFANQLESWLCKMARKGWILIDAKGLGIFVFLKGKPSYRKYFFTWVGKVVNLILITEWQKHCISNLQICGD